MAACAAMVLAWAACSSEVGSHSRVEPPEHRDPALEQLLTRYDGAAKPRVNVLLVSLDSVRRDFMSCYGHVPSYAPEQRTSPNIDRVAAGGVVFEDYHANSSWTLPAHVSLMTGQPDLVHGVDEPLFAIDTSRPTIAAVLRRCGYATAGYYSGTFLHPRFGFGRAFDDYSPAYGPEVMELHQRQQGIQEQIDEASLAGEWDRVDELRPELLALNVPIDRATHRDRSSAFVTDRALAAIDSAETEGRPWFVFAHYFDPHYDYDPPEEYAARFDPSYDGEIDGKRFFHNTSIGVVRRDQPGVSQRKKLCSDRDLDHLRALYAAEIAWTDAQVGRLFADLRRRQVLDHTLVIVVSDHGEEFFEHGGIGHRSTLLGEQIAVPCIMRLPGVLPAGKRVRGLASHVDVFGTVLDLLGLPALETLASRSLLPLVRGEPEPPRHALARLVEAHPASNSSGAPVVLNRITDVYLRDQIKVFRIRQWPEPAEGCPADRAQRVLDAAAEARATDASLVWVDLAEHPDEPADGFRDSFDDPRAADCLRDFQAVYESLSDQDRPVILSFGGEMPWLWRGQQSWLERIASRRAKYLLPPPGR